MSSSPTVSPSASLWCRSCHILVDNSSLLGLPCPFCGLESITEITDPGILAILGVLNYGSSQVTADGTPSNTEGDGDGPSLRLQGTDDSNIVFSSPRHLLDFLAFLATIAGEARLELPEEQQDSQTSESSSPSWPAAFLSPVPEDDASEEDHSYGSQQSFQQNYSHEANQASDTRTVQGQGLDTENDDGENFGRPTDSDEGFLNPMLEFIMHHFAQAESSIYGSAPASKVAVAALPTSQFSKKCNDDEETCCAVCKEIFECGVEVKEMPCQHIYHSGCILPWLKLHSSCPLCRRELPVEEYPGGSTEESLGLPAEGGENSLALFEITGEGIHVLSFVLIGTRATESEIEQNHESAAETEESTQEEASMVAVNGEEDRRLVSLESQDGKVGPLSTEHKPGLASAGSIHAQVEHAVNTEGTAGRIGLDFYESSGSTGETSYSQLQPERVMLNVLAEHETSNEVLLGEDGNEELQGVESTTLDTDNAIDPRMPQLAMHGPDGASGSRYNRIQGSLRSNNFESSLMPRVRSFFSWVFGSPHTRNTDGEDLSGVRHSCW